MTRELTIFDNPEILKQAGIAIRNLIEGKTPRTEVKQREIRGGLNSNYVSTYYMTRQASLITGFRWSSEIIREKYIPDEANPKEIGVFIKVTLYDRNGFAYSHQSWGSAEVKRYTKTQYNKDREIVHQKGDIISLFDDLKAASSDAIKKCLSYFGIANDIYAGKEPEYFVEDIENIITSTTKNIIDVTNQRNSFDGYVRDKHIPYNKVMEVLGVQSMIEVEDYADAYRKIKAWKEGGANI